MATAAQKTQALAALDDLQALAPKIRAGVRALAQSGGNEYLRAFYTGADAGNQIPPAEVLARLDAIATAAPIARTIVNDATTTG